MGFFSDIGSAFKSAGNTIGSGLTKTFNSVIKPAFNTVVKPAANAVVSVATKVESKIERGADNALNLQKNVGDSLGGIGKLLGNPMVVIGALVVGGIVLSKV